MLEREFDASMLISLIGSSFSEVAPSKEAESKILFKTRMTQGVGVDNESKRSESSLIHRILR